MVRTKHQFRGCFFSKLQSKVPRIAFVPLVVVATVLLSGKTSYADYPYPIWASATIWAPDGRVEVQTVRFESAGYITASLDGHTATIKVWDRYWGMSASDGYTFGPGEDQASVMHDLGNGYKAQWYVNPTLYHPPTPAPLPSPIPPH